MPLMKSWNRDFCGHRSCLSRNCSVPGAVTSELLLVAHRGEGGSSPGPNLILLHWVLQPLICCLWVLNCKATFLGTEPRALEEGHAFNLCFLSSFPSAGAMVLAGDQSPGIPALFLLAEVTALSFFLYGFSRISFINYRARYSPGVRVVSLWRDTGLLVSQTNQHGGICALSCSWQLPKAHFKQPHIW